MILLTKAIEKKLPKLYSQENNPDPIVQVKFFCPWNHLTWYGVEYDPKEELFFGFIQGDYGEWSYFSLVDMKEITGPMGLKIERDLYFKPCKFKNLKI